jgi:hypothetical protein
MFVKVDDKDNVLRYPYSAGNVRIDFPNVSFPADFNDESINHLGIHRVQSVQRPEYDDTIAKLVDDVELINESWIQKWVIENIEEDIAISNIRRRRNVLLGETDYMALSDMTLTEDWADYRQALREIPQQEGFPFGVIWPAKPS